MKRLAVALLCSMAGATAAASTADVEAVERARFASLTKPDLAALESVLADDLVYCHSNSRCDTKASFLQSLRSGAVAYKKVDVQQLQVRLYGDTAIINGKAAVQVEDKGKPLAFTISYTDVYVQREGRWKLVSWQSTLVP